jgi:hypothetical protein
MQFLGWLEWLDGRDSATEAAADGEGSAHGQLYKEVWHELYDASILY